MICGQDMSAIKRGNKVETVKGDKFAGTVVALFKDKKGQLCFVVQVDPNAPTDDRPRIFSEPELQLLS